MSGNKVELLLDSRQKFECLKCGHCCRLWRVALSPGEMDALRARRSGTGSGDPVEMVGGYPYIAHRPDGSCFFLDTERRLCRLELESGHNAKPLGCRVYPLNLVTVLPGTVSCGARFDCPAVRQGKGKPLAGQRSEALGFIAEMGFDGKIDERPLVGLMPGIVKLIAEFFAKTATSEGTTPTTGGLALMLAAKNLGELGGDFLNDGSTMREILPQLGGKFRSDALALLADAKAPGGLDKAMFRLWLASCLRRDEEVAGKPFSVRIRRTSHLFRMAFNGGRLAALGSEHPDSPPPSMLGHPFSAEPAAWDSWRRWMNGRLETLQFFGRACYGRHIFSGAVALGSTAPLIAASALAHAAGRGEPDRIASEDVEYATGVIDHGFGRSGLGLTWHHTCMEQYFHNPIRSARILAALGCRVQA